MNKFLSLILIIFFLGSCKKVKIITTDLEYVSKDNLLGKVKTINESSYDASFFTELRDIYNNPLAHKKYKYNKLGDIIEYKESCIVNDKEVGKYVTYMYNDKNLLDKINTYESLDCNTTTKNFIYNSHNVLKEEIIYFNNALNLKKQYSYNEDNSLKEITIYCYNNIDNLELKRRDKYSSEDEKQTIKHFEIFNKYILNNGSEELNYRDFNAKYGSKVDFSKLDVEVKFDFERLCLTEEIEYDSVYINKQKNLLIYSSIYQSDDRDALFSRSDILEKNSIKYNDKGLVLETIKFTKLPFSLEEYKYIYEYDREGNWIKRFKCKKDRVENISKRTYTYFK